MCIVSVSTMVWNKHFFLDFGWLLTPETQVLDFSSPSFSFPHVQTIITPGTCNQGPVFYHDIIHIYPLCEWYVSYGFLWVCFSVRYTSTLSEFFLYMAGMLNLDRRLCPTWPQVGLAATCPSLDVRYLMAILVLTMLFAMVSAKNYCCPFNSIFATVLTSNIGF